jgi:drug/metabolite transporter (DMT)-like permease
MTQIGISIVLGIMSAIFGSFANVSARYIMGFTTTKNYISFNFALMFVLLLPFAPIFFSIKITIFSLALIIGASLIDGLANFLYFRSFEVDDATTASALLSLSPLFSLLLLPVFGKNQTVNPLNITGIIIVVAGIITLNSGMKRTPITDTAQSQKSMIIRLLTPIGASFLFGANIYLIKYILAHEFTNPFTYYLVRALVIAIIMWTVNRPINGWITKKRILIVSLRSVLVIIQWMLLLYALSLGNPAIIKALSDASPLFVIVLAVIFLREKVTVPKIIGSFTIIGGLILLSF